MQGLFDFDLFQFKTLNFVSNFLVFTIDMQMILILSRVRASIDSGENFGMTNEFCVHCLIWYLDLGFRCCDFE